MAALTARTLKTTAFGALAAGTACAAAITTVGLAWPGGAAPDLAPVHEARADQALLAQYPEPVKADRESQATLRQAPMSANAWLRRAYVRQVKTNTLDSETLGYIEQSYRVAPLGPEVSRWRLRFAFEHWPEMTPSLRTMAVREMRNFARNHSGGADLVRSIHNPSGRWAAAMTERLGHNEALRDHGVLAKAAE